MQEVCTLGTLYRMIHLCVRRNRIKPKPKESTKLHALSLWLRISETHQNPASQMFGESLRGRRPRDPPNPLLKESAYIFGPVHFRA